MYPDTMSSRYISRRYGQTERAASSSRESRAMSRERERYSRARTSSPVRERSYSSQYSSTLQYYRPADHEVTCS